MARLRGAARRWADAHPFLLALVVLLAVVIPGFIRTEQAVNASEDAADNVQAQADRNSVIVSCLTTYADDLTDALQDRDVVVQTARAAVQEVWDTFLRLIADPTPPPNARETMIEAIERYQRILARLNRTEAINPYPDITTCLPLATVTAAYRLVAARRQVMCFGRTPTILGTSLGDLIHGTDKSDVIRTFGGDDIVHGGRGNDYICGGRGGDTLNGGQDYDRIRGQRGDDLCIQVEAPRSC